MTARIVPDLTEIATLVPALTDGENALLEALAKILDETWTIYVQPHLNGLHPDIVIFSENAGFGIFEVKDWNLNNYKVSGNFGDQQWSVYDARTTRYVELPDKDTPLIQVEKYKNSLYYHQIPELGARKVLDRSIYGLVTSFVYFHAHDTNYLMQRLSCVSSKYIHVFGNDKLRNVETFRRYLFDRKLISNSKFRDWMRDHKIAERVQSVFHYPEHGKIVKELTKPLRDDQPRLLPCEVGKGYHVLGAAGSGKTFVLAWKAATAAAEGKQVLVVCFNITMQHYLLDLTKATSRLIGPHVHRNIQVFHYHAIFPSSNEEPVHVKGPYDVLLVDEGQDFEIEWIENLLKLCGTQYHFMFFEDDRQDIYLRARNRKQKLPGVNQRRVSLRKSRRLTAETARLANLLIEWAHTKSQSEAIEYDENSVQQLLFLHNTWFNGSREQAIKAIEQDIIRIASGHKGHIADNVFLVCTVEDGWEICDKLTEYGVAFQTNFESRAENNQLKVIYEAKFEEKIDELRRRYKAAFWMQGGKVKVCTVHSFKGWELKNAYLFFNPREVQQEIELFLLYTAITRSQEALTVYNIDSYYAKFGDIAIRNGIIRRWSEQS